MREVSQANEDLVITMAGPLVFLHLSDIHFNKRWHDEFELDKDLRDQLELDVKRVRPNFKEVRGILVSGDIAFGGKIEDYKIARDWLKTLCELVGCREQDVWCVPGNHDVDQKVYDDSFIVRSLHDRLRPKDPAEIDTQLTECMRDPESAKALVRSIENYNTHFASKFSCPSRAKPLHWQHDLELSDKSTLRIYGINSALVSDKHDDEHQKRLIVGTIQVTPKQEPHVVYLAMCHHPPDWLLDHEVVNHNLTARALLQLFGHKHIQRIDQINGCLRIGAGAVHPSRKEKAWKPRYNWIQLDVETNVQGRFLNVKIYPRVWSDANPQYVADFAICDKGQEYKTYKPQLPDWTPPAAVDDKSAASTTASDPTATAGVSQPNPGDAMDAARTLTYRFLDHSHTIRIQIAQSLGLIADEDEGLVDFDLLERIIIRATERKQLEKLWELVEKKHGDNKNPHNPYVGQ